MKRALRIQHACAARKNPRKLDRRFHALATRTAKERFLQVAAGQSAQTRRKFSRSFGHMALQHRRTHAVQLIFDRFNNRWMVVS